jgi:hypothetical protein
MLTQEEKKDIIEISRNGFNAKITTDLGRIHFMMFALEQYIKDNNLNKIRHIYQYLNKPENKLNFELTTQFSDILIKMNDLVGKKDDKGFWEYSIFQKIIIPNEEQNIKSGLKPENSLDLKKINQYINPVPSREEQIFINHNNGLKLSSKDQIIYELYVNKKKEELEKDIKDIQRLGQKATPITTEGKIHYMMYLLQTFINKKQFENVANIYLKLKDPKYQLNSELSNKYANLLNQMNEIIDNLDLISLQFTKFYNQMPPLNERGFNKFDDWQIETINNIDKNISTIISAPTSAGKSVISGYVVTKGKSLYIVPTDALAWQVAAYIGGIMNSDIPIITLTYQSIPKRDLFIKLLNSSKAIVGTPECILDYLPLINCDFKWVIFDEIHMMGKKEGSAMETIAKILAGTPFLGLSATIGNIEEVRDWFVSLGNSNVSTIVCNKRFFNLQKYFFNSDLVMLNPLSLTSYEEFDNGSVINKTLNPTPRDTWSLATKLLESGIELGDLNPYKFFGKTELIELTKTYDYFNQLIKFMVENKEKIKSILENYNSYNFDNYNINLIDLIEKLRDNDKFPSIIFQQNTISCLEIVRKLSEDIENKEIEKYPNLRKDRLAKDKNDKRNNKKLEKELSSLTEKQLEKKLKEDKDFIFDIKMEDDIDAPHNDFIYNKDEKFTDNDVKEWAEKFKTYFPSENGGYHYLIRLLWRGIGVYTIGLPDNYLRLVQKLASKKKLAVVFSDASLVFGISMPFRSSVIYKNSTTEDNLDPMMYHQMAGRAGRRGLDKEGNVIFVGYSWERIKELSTSFIPSIEGPNKLIWSGFQANMVSSNSNYLTLNKHLFRSNFSNLYIENFDNTNNNNYNSIWSFSNEKDINMIQLMWMFRYSNEGVIVSFLLPYLRKYFEICNPNDESKQVEIAYFLTKFIDIRIASREEDVLPELKSTKINFDIIYDKLRDINIDIPTYIDGKIWLSIRNNCLVDIRNDELRHQLFNFSTKLKILQHYCYHTKQVNLTKLLGKLLTRLWWISFNSSPIIRTNEI